MKLSLVSVCMYFVYMFSQGQCLGQHVAPARATLSSGLFIGNNQGKALVIVQSIGQSGVISTHYSNGYILRQGFVQPVSPVPYKTETQRIFKPTVSPNPFFCDISVKTTNPYAQQIMVMVYDIYGRPVFSGIYPGYQADIDLGFLTSGVYVLKIYESGKVYATKVIKTVR